MSIKQKFNDYFSLNDTDLDEEEVVENTNRSEPTQTPAPAAPRSFSFKENKSKSTENVVAINHQQGMKKPRINIIEPRLYSEVQGIADVLLNNQSVVLNFRRMEKEQAKKMIDFLMGTIYAIKGDIQRIGEEIFMCTPQSFEVDGSELQSLKNDEF